MTSQKRDVAWLKQARSDLKFARLALANEFYAQACFIAQQCAEKALKSLLFKRGAKVILTHSIAKLCQEARMNGRLLEKAKLLDQYYLSSRYPDALPDGSPCEIFTKTQAMQAVSYASAIVSKVSKGK